MSGVIAHLAEWPQAHEPLYMASIIKLPNLVTGEYTYGPADRTTMTIRGQDLSSKFFPQGFWNTAAKVVSPRRLGYKVNPQFEGHLMIEHCR